MSLPLSSNYKQLEDGMGLSKESPESTITPKRKIPWKRLGAVVLVGVVYFFGPRKEDLGDCVSSIIWPDVPSESYEVAPAAEFTPTPTTTTIPTAMPSQDDDASPPARPTDPAGDGDLTKTHYCTEPYKAGVPLVQFALMVDMGVAGSRIHIYKFNNCGPSPAFEYEVFKRYGRGAWLFGDSPPAAAQSLDVLLDEAVRVVPESLRGCTPVQVKASAALKLQGATKSSDILAAVRHRLEEKYPFSLQGEGAVEIMEWREQGVYAWLTANYLLSTLSADPSVQKTPPYAVLSLAGVTAQIVYEPTFDAAKPDTKLEEGEHKYELMYDGQRRVLYEHSHRGYGLVTARQSTHRIVDSMSNHSEDAVVPNPCLAKGTNKTVDIFEEQLTGRRKGRSVTMVGGDVSSWQSCNQVVELVLNKDASCEVEPCSFNGVYQPSLLETFPHGKILLLSYYDDRLSPFLTTTANPVKAPIHVSAFADLAKVVCQGPTAWKEHWGSDAALMQELEQRPEWCLDLTYMHALLLGYGLEGNREIQLRTQFGGMELGWFLGATVATIAGVELKCRV
ncbi:hypothetical protein K466DRAFT_590491 [Polyporus arcularius HHB13444]|uniref:guanosine-diphosphatase n=1 Tax=Polyporus arcularius HHB13444 TaxID=1314778 RepID=A0A5C3P0Y1_9APHY|nr:hypothetical protein K466DRAFT_590491 [Polyporus arcularius HHB13444]